ncbi:hypothetical protein B5S31_g5783 [[Candida] boidinii]|nr:hypothetical protein B5S31_g5783 [[Candida] boidinii]
MQPIDLKIFATNLQDDNLSSIFSKLSTGGTNMTSITGNSMNNAATNVASTLATTSSVTTTAMQKPLITSKPKPPITPKRDNFEYAEALYDYIPQQKDDLQFKSGDKIKIIEKKSEYWWFGELNSKTGMMPANYVKLLTNTNTSNVSLPVSSNTTGSYPDKNEDDLAPPSYSAPSGPPPNNNYQQQPYQQQPYQQQPYQQQPYQQQPYQQQPYQQQPYQQQGQQLQQQLQQKLQQQGQNAMQSYQQQPYQQQQQQVQQQQQPQTILVENPQDNNTNVNNNQVISEGAKKFGSKLGNAAIFGAGATIGSNIVNSIF